MPAQNKSDRFRILLGDDRSEYALAAVELLEDLHFPSGTDVTVFRALAPTQATDLILMEEALNQTCKRLKKKGLQAKPELLLGSPTSKFLEYAEKQTPDLIIVGAKGLRATTGILLVTDGSAASQQTVQFLGRLPLPGSVRLWVMHVLPPPPIPMPGVGMPLGRVPPVLPVTEEVAALRAKEEQEGQALVDLTIQALQNMGKPARGILRRGDAATEIMAAVKELAIDLLVTGSRGLSPVRSWLMGSVSRKLVHYSGCSVLVVRGQAQD